MITVRLPEIKIGVVIRHGEGALITKEKRKLVNMNRGTSQIWIRQLLQGEGGTISKMKRVPLLVQSWKAHHSLQIKKGHLFAKLEKGILSKEKGHCVQMPPGGPLIRVWSIGEKALLQMKRGTYLEVKGALFDYVNTRDGSFLES